MGKSLKCIINFSNSRVENSHWQELCIEAKAVVEDFDTSLQIKAAQFYTNQHFQWFMYTEVHSSCMMNMFHCAICWLEITESKHIYIHKRNLFHYLE